MIDRFIEKYRKRGLLLDTNLLLFYLVGLYDPSYIGKYKRTCMYDKVDFVWMDKFINNFHQVYITPQIVGELWNFVEKMPKHRLAGFIETALLTLVEVTENYVEKNIIFDESCFSYVGVTDVSIICSARKLGCLVLTDDLRSYSFYVSNGVEAINLNHLRPIEV